LPVRFEEEEAREEEEDSEKKEEEKSAGRRGGGGMKGGGVRRQWRGERDRTWRGEGERMTRNMNGRLPPPLPRTIATGLSYNIGAGASVRHYWNVFVGMTLGQEFGASLTNSFPFVGPRLCFCRHANWIKDLNLSHELIPFCRTQEGTFASGT
jgi:hypothetical protein